LNVAIHAVAAVIAVIDANTVHRGTRHDSGTPCRRTVLCSVSEAGCACGIA